MRYLEPHILQDLSKKMVFLTGPRQCGKTTLSQSILNKFKDGLYLNWDDPDHRKLILKRNWSDENRFIVLDEIHKMKNWKNFIKGTYDTQKEQHQFLITGSARLNVFRRGGDSLLGRYHLWHLHPFTLSEYAGSFSLKEAYTRLMTVGGFPEPFLDNDDRAARRWRFERLEKVIKEDVRELEQIKNIQSMEMLVDLLRTRVGSPVVFSNLAEDLQVSPVTVKAWVEILESMYVIFQVKPFTHKLSRAIQKPPKIYFYDNADVEGDEGAMFENLVASHLLKMLQYAQDYTGHQFKLSYVRDKEKHEVDFVILKDNNAIELIEAKLSDKSPSKHLSYFAEKIGVKKALQITNIADYRFTRGQLKVSNVYDELSDMKRFFKP